MYSFDDMYMPVMYEDIMNPSFGNISPVISGLYPATNFLGDIKMQPQPAQDAYEIIDKKKDETKKNFKSIFKIIGLLVLGGLIPPAFKYAKKSGNKLFGKISKMCGNLWNKIKGGLHP